MARMVDQALRDAGIDTFRDDRDIDGGDRIPDEIRTEIAKSDELVVVWTAQTLTSEWVKQEIGAAWGLGRRVVPLLHVVDPVTLPPSVKDAKAYPINDVDQYLKEVVARAKPTHV